MEWVVTNALNRDVERQHLNKILKEIRAAIDAAGSGGTTTNTVQTINNRYAVANFMLTLTGAVSGSAQINGLGDVTLTTTSDGSLGGVEEAPIDNQYYWRWNGQWDVAPPTLINFLDIEGEGIVVRQLDADFNPTYTVREIQTADSSRLTITDGDAVAANPILDLAEVADTGGGSLVKIDRDAYGRVAGTSTPNTGDLAEGSNLYYTDERVDDRVATLLTAGTNITLTYDDTAGTLEITAAGGSSGNIDGGDADSIYGGTTPIDGGGA